MALETMIAAYIECALWSSLDNDALEGRCDRTGEHLDDNFGPEDLSPDARATMEADCKSFYEDPSNAPYLELWDDAQAGHDFWLTRNGHGAGFWDRHFDGGELEAAGDALTKASKPYGEVDLYIGDDNLIHHS